MNINDLTDEELARAADLYIATAYRRLRGTNPSDWINISINAHGFSGDTEIIHKIDLHVGKNEQSIKGNNILTAVDKLRQRVMEDDRAQPTKITLALAAPKEPEGETAEFTEIDDRGHF